MFHSRIFLLAGLLIVLAALTFLPPTALAAPDEPDAGFTTQIVRGNVQFTIPADACSMLPSGIEVSGSGKRFQVINTKTKPNGSQVVISNDFVKGTASDGNGGTYNFVYTNQARYNYPPGNGAIKVNMTDSFILDNTNGSNDYAVAFHWTWTYTPPDGEWPPNDNWVQHMTIGDPLTCDPI